LILLYDLFHQGANRNFFAKHMEIKPMGIDSDLCNQLFSQDKLDALFPSERADQFFDALFGDASEGAYDIRLAFNSLKGDQLNFDFELHQRPGKCLACNLTYGLPQVFERHPIINTGEVVEAIDAMLNGEAKCAGWKLGKSKEISRQLHVVPLIIEVDQS
jgi:hypothetical protein